MFTFITKIVFNLFLGIFYGKITNNFEPCLTFFYNKMIPQGVSGDAHVALCQLYENHYHFATLYDTSRRIPLYSAYILSEAVGSRPKKENWKVEPQLKPSPDNTGMEYQKDPDQNVRESQAVDEDYINSGYTRGHLAPSSHQKTVDDRRATFTLTNIVPQTSGSNNGPWNFLEQEMLERSKQCTSHMYVITGVMPYESNEPTINNRVHVPEYLWMAYCCPSSSPQADQTHFPTYAAVGRNDPNSPEDIVGIDPNLKPHFQGFAVRQMPLETLEEILKTRLKMPKLSLFKDRCQNN